MLTIQNQKVIDTMIPEHINPGARKIEDEPYQPPKAKPIEERTLEARVFDLECRICTLEKAFSKFRNKMLEEENERN